MALPTSVAVSLPCFVTAVRALRQRGRELSIPMVALIRSSVLFSIHNLDFAFLRDIPELTPPLGADAPESGRTSALGS